MPGSQVRLSTSFCNMCIFAIPVEARRNLIARIPQKFYRVILRLET